MSGNEQWLHPSPRLSIRGAAPARRGGAPRSREGSGLAGGPCFITCVGWGGRAGAEQARDAGPWGPSDTVPGAVSGPDHSIRTLWAPVRKALSCPAPWPGHREALLPAADPLHQQGANPPEPARPSVGIHSSNREPLAEWGKPGPGQQGLCLLAEASPGLPQVWLPPCPTLTRSPGATDPR